MARLTKNKRFFYTREITSSYIFATMSIDNKLSVLMSFSSPAIANYIYTLLSSGKYSILVGPLNLFSHKNFSSYLYFYSSVFRAREDFTVQLCNPRQRHVLKPLMMYYTLLCSVFMKVEEKPRTRDRHATHIFIRSTWIGI